MEIGDMEKGLLAAVRRFPLKGLYIRQLAIADDTFLSLCDDLADAEAAVELWGLSTTSQRDLRRNEYEVLANELAAEIEQRLEVHVSERRSSAG